MKRYEEKRAVIIGGTSGTSGMGLTAYGAFLVAQQAARRMLPNGKGAILFTGASAGVKGYPQSAAFAMGKFAQTTVSIRMRSPRHTCIC